MLELIYCSKCFDSLAKDGGIAVELYQEICEEYVTSDEPFFYSTDLDFQFTEIIRYLELKNYIITTEKDLHNVVAKPSGVTCYDDDVSTVCFICAKDSIHD